MIKAVAAATYYVDYTSGNDSNNGTAKLTPWQHAKGMQGCANVCNSTTINAGDSIILKGGVAWPNAVFMWSLPGGSAGNPVYIGVDKTWFTGGSWARPILNAQGSLITNNFDTMMWVPDNVSVDNFEITGFFWTLAACSGAPFGSCTIFNCGQHNGQIWENLYIHGWTHPGTDAASTNGVVNLFAGGGGGTSIANDNVIVGTDVPGDHSVNVFFNVPAVAYNNYIKQVSSAFILSYPSSIHDNHIEDIGPAYCNMPFPANAGNCTHENGFEDNGDIGLYFYNNVITNVNAGLALWVAPNPTSTVYVWNNVIYNIHDNQVIDLAQPVYNVSFCSTGQNGQGYCNNSGSYVFWNNTIQCGDDTTLYDVCQKDVSFMAGASFLFQNNHFISLTTAHGCTAGSTNCTFDFSNVVQTLSTAIGQGYTSSQTFAFSPTAGSNSTVGAGTNLTSSATGGLASLHLDTTYACSGGSAVSCPARTAIARPASAAWDIGAYQYIPPPTGSAILGTSLSGPGAIR